MRGLLCLHSSTLGLICLLLLMIDDNWSSLILCYLEHSQFWFYSYPKSRVCSGHYCAVRSQVVNYNRLYIFLLFLRFYFLQKILFILERACEQRDGQRGREKILSRLCAEPRAQLRAWSCYPEITTRARTKSGMLNQLSHHLPLQIIFLSNLYTRWETRTHNPEIGVTGSTTWAS